jgi:hypothetical protein
MKKELLVLTASLALATSMSAGVNRNTVINNRSDNSGIFRNQNPFSLLMAREAEPGDDRGRNRGRGGKDDGKGHKVMQNVAREAEPGDDRGRNRRRGGKDDGKGHKVA